MKVALFFSNHVDNLNSRYHAPLWDKAVRALGWAVTTKIEECDFAAMWGPQPEYFKCKRLGKPVLIVDFPYWNRAWKVKDGREYYKISLNGQHQTPYIMQEKHAADRYLKTNGPVIREWKREGDYILLCGIGHKAAVQYGYGMQQWEIETINKIKQHTDKKIVYRRKPSNKSYPPIKGVDFDDGAFPMAEALERAELAVCHHGNSAIDALAAGVPIFMKGAIGVASHLANLNIANINKPYYPDFRDQFFYNLAYWQWSVDEISKGIPLISMHERGLI